MTGRTPHRQLQALALLTERGALPTSEIARRLDMQPAHVRRDMKALRAAGRVCIVGNAPGQGERQAVWALVPPKRQRADQWDAVRELEGEIAERERWMLDVLDKWARFMRSYWGPHGYPTSSPGMAGKARIQSFEDLEEQMDRHLVAACNAALDDLPDRMRAAIFFSYQLQDLWPYSDCPYEAAETARDLLAFRMEKRAAVPDA